MSTNPRQVRQNDGYVLFKTRFRAWWHGEDAVEVVAGRGKQAVGNQSLVIDRPVASAEADTAIDLRIALLDGLWGEGFVGPGGGEYLISLLRSCDLDSSSSVVELGAGMGGGARAVNTAFGAWTAGLEPMSAFVKRGQELSRKHGQEQRVVIIAGDITRPDRLRKKFDCVFSRERLFAVVDKHALLEAVRRALKSQGYFVFTDYVLDRDSPRGETFREWFSAECLPPRPWTVDRYRTALADHGLNALVFKDVTERYCTKVARRWARYVDGLDSAGLDRAFVDAILHEADLWRLRVRVLQEGDMRVLRVHARGHNTTPLSNW